MQMAAAGQGAGRQEERGRGGGPGQPMTCLADASFQGVVVDDLRQRASERASYRLRLAAAPPCRPAVFMRWPAGSTTTKQVLKQVLSPPQKYRYEDKSVPMLRYWFISIPVLLGWMEFMNEP